jgi:hypothetical protein
MATQKKKKKRQTKSKRAAGKQVTPGKRLTGKTRHAAKKKSAKKKATQKKATKTKLVARKAISRKTASARTKRARKKRQSVATFPFPSGGRRSRSGGQSGDLQGLSRSKGADSESVGELLEEGNAFEADVVAGVEEADSADEREVHTHEVPEDDVPGEYLDKD